MTPGTRKIIIAIDGYSSCGKSTLARDLARRLNYLHIDSGAMYRAVTLYFLRHRIDLHDAGAVDRALACIHLHLARDQDRQVTWLNHENVEEAIRDPRVNERVSDVAALPAVRHAMVRQQRRMSAEKGIVMDGRDIGTVVFPEAELKLFITADIEIRVDRRWREAKAKGQHVTRQDIKTNLERRDRIDASRSDSPLMKADDATVIDTSYLTPAEQVQIAFDLARAVIGRPAIEEEDYT